MIVQDKTELWALFNLMKGCSSFLEVGSCYGFSLQILAHALKPKSKIVCVDLCEPKSFSYLEATVQKLKYRGYGVEIVKGDSTKIVNMPGTFDAVLIDASHHYENVKRDVENFRSLAKKLFIMHDITMDGPGRVFDEIGGGLRIVNDHAPSKMGYGVQFL